MKTQEEIINDWEGDINQPPVSIQCLTHNHEQYIETTIKGFLKQETNFPFEVIVHDDASDDKTAEIIKNYAKKYPHIIKPILQIENKFSCGKKQDVHDAIYSIIRGKYIAICEGDDYWIDPKKIQKQYDVFCRNKDIVLSIHTTWIKQPNEDTYDIFGFHSKKERFCQTSEIIIHGCAYSHIGAVMIKRDVFLQAAFFNNYKTPPFYDCFLIYYASLKGLVHYMPDIMSVYRLHNKGWTTTKKDYNTLIKQHIKTLAKLDKETFKNYQKEIKYNISKMMYSASQYYNSQNDQNNYILLINRSLRMKPVYYGTLVHYYRLRKLPKFGHTLLKKIYSFYCKLNIK